jgi:hypothetical protein
MFYQVHIYQHCHQRLTDIDLGELKFNAYILHGPHAALPMQWYECQPVMSSRIAIMMIQPENATHVTVIWTGNIWNFRGALDIAGIAGIDASHVMQLLAPFNMYVFMLSIDVPGMYDEVGMASTKRNRDGIRYNYYRVLRNINITNKHDMVKRIVQTVFNNIAMLCIVTARPEAGSVVAKWLLDMEALSNLHFRPGQEEQCFINTGCRAGASEIVETQKSRPSKFNLVKIKCELEGLCGPVDVHSLLPGDPPLEAPSESVLQFFEPAFDLWLAFDIETHDWVPKSKDGKGRWIDGKYGHACRFIDNDLQQLRISQLGWVVGRFSTNSCIQKEFTVYPDGFEITSKATLTHGITNEHARCTGKPLKTVLRQFLVDVEGVVQQGGRVCAHQLEFDAGVIALELDRAGLGNQTEMWAQVASDGFCTMNPTLSKWSCQAFFDQMGCRYGLGRNCSVGLRDMVLALAPTEVALLSQHHNAGADANLTWKVLRELHDRARC